MPLMQKSVNCRSMLVMMVMDVQHAVRHGRHHDVEFELSGLHRHATAVS